MATETTMAPATPCDSTGALHLTVSDSGQRYTLGHGATTIGAGPKCDLRLHGAGVRPLHCVVTQGQHGVTVRRWATGALLNGKPFTESSLQAGDCLTLGSMDLIVGPGDDQEHKDFEPADQLAAGSPIDDDADPIEERYQDCDEAHDNVWPDASLEVAAESMPASDPLLLQHWECDTETADAEPAHAPVELPRDEQPAVEPAPESPDRVDAVDWSVTPTATTPAAEDANHEAYAAPPIFSAITPVNPVPAHLLKPWQSEQQAVKSSPTDEATAPSEPVESAADGAGDSPGHDQAAVVIAGLLEPPEAQEESIADQDIDAENNAIDRMPPQQALAADHVARALVGALSQERDESEQREQEVQELRERVDSLGQTLEAARVALEDAQQQHAAAAESRQAMEEEVARLTSALEASEGAGAERASQHAAAPEPTFETLEPAAHAQSEQQPAPDEHVEPEADLWSRSLEDPSLGSGEFSAGNPSPMSDWLPTWSSEPTAAPLLEAKTDAVFPAEPRGERTPTDPAREIVQPSPVPQDDMWDLERTALDDSSAPVEPQVDSSAQADEAPAGTAEPDAWSPAFAPADKPTADAWSQPSEEADKPSEPEPAPAADSPTVEEPTPARDVDSWLEGFRSDALPAEPLASEPAEEPKEPASESLDSRLPEMTTPDAGEPPSLEASEEPPSAAPAEPTFEEPKSFYEQYAHLLPSDEEPAPPAAEPATPEFTAPLSEPAAQQPASDGEEDIESYMAQLMDRMRSGASAVRHQAENSQASDTARPAAPMPAPPVPAPASVQPITSLDEMKRSKAPEQHTDMNSLRQLANQSARHAIGTAASKQNREKSLANLIIAIIAVASGGYLVTSASSALTTQFFGGAFAILLAGVWVFRAAGQMLNAFRNGKFDDEPEKEIVKPESLPIARS